MINNPNKICSGYFFVVYLHYKTKYKDMVYYKCDRCGEKHMARETKKAIQEEKKYIEPFSCNGGDYYVHDYYFIMCDCNRRIEVNTNDFPYNDYTFIELVNENYTFNSYGGRNILSDSRGDTFDENQLMNTVNAVIINNEGNILCVSRKTNHSDFGLPGGKVDPEDYENKSFYDALQVAIIREVKEETGYDVINLKQIFSIAKYDSMGFTFLCEIEGEMDYDEPHVVKWGTAKDLIDGSFGKYNKMVMESLKTLKINHL